MALPVLQRRPADALDALRRSTRESHERLQRHLFFRAALAGKIELNEYRRMLARLLGFHVPLEQTLLAAAATAGPALDMERRRRAHLLAEDLAFLVLERSEIERLPRVELAPPAGVGQILGRLYVREGSMRGGRWIAQKIAPLLGEVAGRSFLLGDPADDALWRECCATIGLVEESRLSEMILEAKATFAAFEAWISEP
jgi:heme oxygenase (biliverdin-IX-beta and delta-forming)